MLTNKDNEAKEEAVAIARADKLTDSQFMFKLAEAMTKRGYPADSYLAQRYARIAEILKVLENVN